MTLLFGAGTALAVLAIPVFLYSFRNAPPPLVLVRGDPERAKCGSPMELWLYDSLKMRGFVVETKVPCGPYEIELALPSHKIAISCEVPEAEQKVSDRRKQRYLKRNGWRIIDIRPQCLYRDFQEKLRKIDVYKHN